MKPVITLNGTSIEHLLSYAEQALRAVSDAGASLQSVAPNGRDYIGHNDRFQEAQKEFEQMLNALRKTEKTLGEYFEYLSEEQDKRARR